MAYSKNTWATGDVITAEKLNSIENAVGNVSSSVDSMAPSVAKIDNIEDSIGDINSEINSMAPTLAKVNPLESAVQSLSSEIASARNYNSSGTANTLGGRIDELVRISNTQPGGNNEIWVNSGNSVVETEVPTYQEFNNLIVNQNTQPSAASNRIWIPTSGGEEVEVPDMGEFNKLKNSNAPEYSNNATYAVDEYVFHNGNLYRCQTAITTAETWTAAHWTQVTFESEIRDLKNAESESVFVSYNAGTGDDDSVAQINIDLKKDRQGYFIRYQMGHCVSESVNANIWRLMYLYKVDSTKTSASVMTRKGEFECALHLGGREDFSGGVVHGDERDQNVTFICDGVITSESNVNGLWKNFTVVRNSILYDSEDSVTPIAEHGVEYVYTPNGLTINQSIKWLVSERLTSCYLAMLPIFKTYSGIRYDNTSFTVTQNPESGLDVIIPNATSVTEIGNDVSSSISIPVYPSGLPGGDCAWLRDGGSSYNKVYFVVCSSGTSQIGELWKSTTNYDIH